MPDFDRTASFHFRRGMTRTRFVKAVVDIASKYGISLDNQKTCCKQVFSKQAIARALRQIFSDEDRKALRGRNVLSLPPEKLKILTRAVQFDEYKLKKSDGSLKLDVDISEGNDFPALSASIWLSKAIDLPAGFFRVYGADAVAARNLYWDLLLFSGC